MGVAKQIISRVPLAWPTVMLSVMVVSLWVASTSLALMGLLPSWLAALVNGAAAFFAFTPMHDAAHKAVGRAAWLNAAVGYACALLLVAPFPAFRFLHLTHHKHTNEVEHDPDMWSASGPWWQLPFRWLTQDLHYYAVYFRHWASRPRRERAITAAGLVGLYGAALALSVAGFATEVFLLWLLPARLAMAVLAWGFDYLPHRPHLTPAREDRFAATRIVANRWLTPLFLYQNYHLIHHLYPAVPFYRYGKVWRAKRDQLLAQGARVDYLFGRERAPLRPWVSMVVVTGLICSSAACSRSPQTSTDTTEKPSAADVTAPPVTTSGQPGIGSATVKTNCENKGITLYQPENVLGSRINGATALATYVKAIEGACNEVFAEASAPEVLDIIVAVRPSGASRAWYVSTKRKDGDALLAVLSKRIEKIPTPTVRGGPIAFALEGSIAGGTRSVAKVGYDPPMPAAWRNAASKLEGPGAMPDVVLAIAWPEAKR